MSSSDDSCSPDESRKWSTLKRKSTNLSLSLKKIEEDDSVTNDVVMDLPMVPEDELPSSP